MNINRRSFPAQGCAILGESYLATSATSRAAKFMALAQCMPPSSYVPISYPWVLGDDFDKTDQATSFSRLFCIGFQADRHV